jgi:hypothetical protein
MLNEKRPPIAMWLIPLAIGLVGFYRVVHSQRFELYRTVDVVQLLASGACFGATLVGIILMLRRSRA